MYISRIVNNLHMSTMSIQTTYTLTPVQTPGLPRTLYFHQNPLETELQV
jgi:hypothetical protein